MPAVPDDAPPPILVDSPATLAAAAARWSAAAVLSFDTEFVRERTFYQKLGLVQVGDGAEIWLVDPLAVGSLEPIAAVLRLPAVIKVLHSASEDLEVFHHRVGAQPAPLFDTQVAAGLAGLPPSLGYGKLVQELFGVELFKGETRTDWLQRPLSAAQLSYAAEDVTYLLPIFHRLRERLSELGRFEWALEDSAALLDPQRYESDPERAVLRLRAAGRFNRRQHAAARELVAWREAEARRRDLPRSFVLKDELLVQLASRQPLLLRDLHRLPAFDPRQGARDGGYWLEILKQVAARSEEELPPKPWRPDENALRNAETRLREIVRQRAATLGLEPEVLASRRDLSALLRETWRDDGASPAPAPSGWRQELTDELRREARALRPATEGA